MGKSTTSAFKTVYVDNTRPNLTLTAANMQLVNAGHNKNKPGHYMLTLSGTVSDPNLATGQAGSGIPADGVAVTLRTPSGAVLGDGAQVAAITGGNWTAQYDFTEPEASGCYDVEVVAVDNVARLPGLDASQLALPHRDGQRAHQPRQRPTRGPDQLEQHRERPDHRCDGHAERRALTPAPSRSRSIGPPTQAERAQALRLAASTATTAAGTTPMSVPRAASRQTPSTRGPRTRAIHQGATCKVTLPASGPTGVASGVIKVCGTQIKTWTTERVVDFVAYSAACGADTCGTALKVSPVTGVDLAFTSLLPGSAYYSDAPRSGEVLRLAFEETPASTGVLTPLDTSGNGRNATCSACPRSGQSGPSGMGYAFNGTSQYLSVADNDAIDFALGQDFSVLTWVRPDPTQPTTANSDNDIVEKWSQSAGYPYAIRYINEKGGTNAGKIQVARHNGSAAASLNSTRTVNDGKFHHVAFVKTGSTLSLYIDGTLDGSVADLTSGTTTNTSPLSIGRRGNGVNYFAGMIDDVRIFNRGLTQSEIRSIFAGPGPLLLMPFEAPAVADGATVSDASGWGHEGAFIAGSTDGTDKAATGQVGEYSLRFDGADDYVAVPPDAGLDLSGGQFTEAAWVYSESTDSGYHGIVGYEPAAGLPQRYPSMWVYQQTSIHAGFGDGTNWNSFTKASALRSGWNHVATTYDGVTYRLYANGAEIYSTTSFSGRKPYAGTQQVHVGKAGKFYFKGSIDDVRLYARALAAGEIRDLYRSGWQAATLGTSTDGGESNNWTAAVPSTLEGSYRVDLRGADAAGHSGSVRERTALWSGEADTQGPRVTFTKKAIDASTNEYTTVAEDYNLVTTNFNSPCGAGTVSTSEKFRSPWYLSASAAGDKLFRVTAKCQKTAGTVTEQAKACDSVGNCTTITSPGVVTGTAGDGMGDGMGAAVGAGEQAAEPLSRMPGPSQLDVLFASKFVTSTYYAEPRTVNLTGYIVQRGSLPAKRGLASIQVSIGGVTGSAILSEPAPTAPYTITWRFPWTLPPGELPDGIRYTAVVTATDRSGAASPPLTADLVVDVVPPAPVTLSLASGGVALAPGDVIRTANPELVLAWTPSSDGSGLEDYRVTWTAHSAVTTTVGTSLRNPAGPLEDRHAAGEAEQIYVAVESRDRLGNVQRQSFGPVVADTPLTPDFIELPPAGSGGTETKPYDEWMGSGCSLLSTDRRLAQVSRTSPSSRGLQRGYGTWDGQALRLAWTGANWNTDGDLFFYLDTAPGGTAATFVPLPSPSGPTVTLGDLEADQLVWVQDAATASLLRWDGSAWITATLLSDAQFRFDPSARGGQTDLYLPFELLRIDPTTTVAGQAFAAEEPRPGSGLQLWATMPQFNPVNTARSTG